MEQIFENTMVVPMHITVKPSRKIALTNENYNKYKKMIQKYAWEASRMCGEDYEEMLSRGNLIFCEATKTYDPDKGAFSTHLGWKLLSLKHVTKDLFAPNTSNGVRNYWSRLENCEQDDEGHDLNLDPLEAVADYSDKMENVNDSSWEARIQDFRQYMEAMDEDTYQLCYDILDGEFEDPDWKKRGPQAYFKAITNIPIKRFVKKYEKNGWSIVRVQNALDNLRTIVKQWKNDLLPAKIVKKSIMCGEDLF